MTDLADRLEEASRGWEAAYLNIASALFAEAAREYRAALRRVEALEAEMARRDKSELRNCINWGPCSRNDDCMKGGPKLSRALMEKNDV